jgi:hypothetical protein
VLKVGPSLRQPSSADPALKQEFHPPQGHHGRIRLLCPDRLQGQVHDRASQQRWGMRLRLPGGDGAADSGVTTA